MEFDAASFLENLFSGTAPADGPQAVPDVSTVGSQAAPVPAAGDGPAGIGTGDGEAGGAATVPEADGLRWIEPDEDIPFRSCPMCGGSDIWETIGGTWRCQHCDATALARSRSLAEKAARLRERSLRQRLADEARPGRYPGPKAASRKPAASTGL
jgi:hypothetical protein